MIDMDVFLSWIKLLGIITPIAVFGIYLVNKLSSLKRLELLLPVGVIVGFSSYIFLTNLVFNVFSGRGGIFLSYGVMVVVCVFFLRYLRLDFSINRKTLLFWIFSLISWGGFLFWKVGHPLIGGDVGIYYSIASSFIRGNYPPVAPWQSSVELSYHIGVLELLGSVQYLSGLTFEFLHLFFSLIFILSSVQIVIWLMIKKINLKSYIFANIIATIVFLSFGFLKIAVPVSLDGYLKTTSPQEFVLWARELPSARESIELYGVPTNIDSLVYVIFHSSGFGLLLAILVLVAHPREKRSFVTWVLVFVSLASLALINEAIFVSFFPAVVAGVIVWMVFQSKESLSEDQNWIQVISEVRQFAAKDQPRIFKDLWVMGLLISVLLVVVFLQGGVVSRNIKNSDEMQSSVIVFPKAEDITGNFQQYHLDSMKTKIHSVKESWGSFFWISLGVELMLVAGLIFAFFHRIDPQRRLVVLIIFFTALCSLLAYNFIVPKYVVANGNRILVIGYQLLGVLAIFFFVWLISLLRWKFLRLIMYGGLMLVVVIPTLIPPIATLSKTRFGENKLTPRSLERSESVKWAIDNLSIRDRVVVLDARAPHPSGIREFMINSGFSAPVFAGGFKSYSIEAGPEYIDIVYTLSPLAIKKLGISYVFIDSDFYLYLAEERRSQLENGNYFEKVFESRKGEDWAKIFRIKEDYLKEEELPGTLEELEVITPKTGTIYVDNEKNFKPDFLRRAVIFTLRDRDLYYVTGSGVYQHTETEVAQKEHKSGNRYRYYILANGVDPKSLCGCKVKLLWQGYGERFALWKDVDY